MSHCASDQAGAPSASCWGRSAPPAPWRLSKGFLDPGQRPLGVDTRRFLIDSIRLVHLPMLPRGTFVLFLARA